jgi:hypothetical protein
MLRGKHPQSNISTWNKLPCSRLANRSPQRQFTSQAPLSAAERSSSTPDQVGTRVASVFMGPTGWAEPWNRLGDWQASSESSRASKSSNRMLLFYTDLRAPTERTPPRAIASKPRSPLQPGGSSFKMTGIGINRTVLTRRHTRRRR